MKQAIPPSIFEKPYVRFWPLADIGVCTAQSAFGGAEYRARQGLKRSPLATDNSAANISAPQYFSVTTTVGEVSVVPPESVVAEPLVR